MCVVSMVGDYWKNGQPWLPQVPTTSPNKIPSVNELQNYFGTVSKAEFEKLKKEVEELRKLLEAAVKYDEATSQPHCETEDKVEILRNVAKALGVDLKDIIL